MQKMTLIMAKVLRRMPGCSAFSRKFNGYRHEVIMRRIWTLCDTVAQGIRAVQKVGTSANDGPIWILWWQGLEHAPAVVRACVTSIRERCGGRDVIVITRDNVREYADLPDYIYDKLDAGAMTLTHFSDILRFNLLHRHSGLWMDATLYAAKTLDAQRCFGAFFTCSGYADPTGFFVSEGKWTGFFIGGSADEPLFSFMDAFFRQYWKGHDALVDYFLIDYVLRYAYDHNIGSLRTWADTQSGKDNSQLFGLEGLVSRKFDPTVWECLTADTAVFKLSWKKPKAFPSGSFGEYVLTHCKRGSVA